MFKMDDIDKSIFMSCVKEIGPFLVIAVVIGFALWWPV